MITYDKNSFNSIPTDGDESYYDFHASEWYINCREKGGVFFTKIYLDNYKTGLMITCAAPFYDAEEKFAGVVGMDILIADLYRAVIDVDLGKYGDAFLVDRSGNIIAPPGQEKSGNRTIHDVTHSLADKIMSGDKGFLRSDSGIYYAYALIKGTDWRFCARIPESVVSDPVNSMNERIIFTILSFLGAFVIIVVLSIIAARKFSGRLTDPIIALESDVQKISGGNLDYRAEIRTNDEIGDLAESFNNMAASLKDYVKNLAAVTAEKERIGDSG